MFFSRKPFLSCALTGAIGLLAFSAASMTASRAAAQTFSAKTFLEPIVDQFGPKYQDVDTAIARLRAGKLAESKELLKTARMKNPELPPASVMLAQILFRVNQSAAARAALEEAVHEDPNDPAAYIFLGDMAFQNRRWTEAKLLYETGMGLAEKYTANNKRKDRLMVNVYAGFASLAEIRENWTGAKTNLQSLLKIDDKNTLAMTRLGRVLFKMANGSREDENKAYRVFQSLHKIDPATTAFADVNMGLLYEAAGKRNFALRMMQQAARNDANNIKSRLAVARWALDTNNLDLAKENADAALQLDPSSLDAKLYAGLVARFNNDLPRAEEVFKKAHLQSPTNLTALTQLALVLVDQSDEQRRAEALEYARLNTRVFSDLTKASGREAAVTLGWVLSRRGQPTEAVRAIQRAITAGNLGADSTYYAAQILYDSGQTDAAGRLLASALQSDAVFPSRTSAEQLMTRIRSAGG